MSTVDNNASPKPEGTQPTAPRVVSALEFIDDPFLQMSFASEAVVLPNSVSGKVKVGEIQHFYHCVTEHENTKAGVLRVYSEDEDRQQLNFTFGASGKIEKIEVGWWGGEISPERHALFAAHKQRLFEALEGVLPAEQAEQLRSFREANMLDIGTQLGLQEIGFSYKGENEIHPFDARRDIRVEVRNDSGIIRLHPTNGTLSQLSYAPRFGDIAEVLVLTEEKQLNAKIQHARPEVLQDRPAHTQVTAALGGEAERVDLSFTNSCALSDMPLRFNLKTERGRPIEEPIEHGTQAERDAAMKRSLMELLAKSGITVIYAGEEKPHLTVSYTLPYVDYWNVVSSTVATIAPMSPEDDRVVGLKIGSTQPSPHFHAKIEDNQITLSRPVEWGEHNGWFNFQFPVATAAEGDVTALLGNGQTLSANYKINPKTNAAELNISVENEQRLHIDITGQQWRSVSILQYDDPSSYHDISFEELWRQHPETMALLDSELQSHEAYKVLRPIFRGNPLPTYRATPEELQGSPLIEGRWERVFGPTEEPVHPRLLIAQPDLTGSPIERAGDDPYSIRRRLHAHHESSAEAFEVMRGLGLRLANPRAAAQILDGMERGYVCLVPGVSSSNHTMHVALDGGKLYLAGMFASRSFPNERVHYITLDCPEWHLDGLLSNGQGKVSRLPTFILDKPLDQIGVEVVQNHNGSQTLSDFPGLTRAELNQLVRDLLKQYYTQVGDRWIRPAGLRTSGNFDTIDRIESYHINARQGALFQAGVDTNMVEALR